MKNLNYYEILKVHYRATSAEIKKSYHKLLKKFHPDISKNSDAHDITILINQAYLVLSDPLAREKYDHQLLISDDFEQNLDKFFESNKAETWEEGKATSIFDKIYGFGKKESTSFEFKNSRFSNSKTFWNNETKNEKEVQKNFQFQYENNKGLDGYYDNAFDVKINRKIVKRYCRAFDVEWSDILEILNELNLTKKEIYLRCYHNQHFFSPVRLSAKQILAENVFKSVIVYSDEYNHFINQLQSEKTRLNLSAKFYFDRDLLENDFEKIIRYYRLLECKFCESNGDESNHLKYCHFCLNKKFLKERMAVNITWKKNQAPKNGTLIYQNFGNRNEHYIGDLI